MRSALPILVAAFAALAACSGSVDVPPDNNNPDGGDTGAPGTDTAPPSTTCEAALTVVPASPIAELRTKIAFPIKITTSDLGGAAGDHPLKVVLLKDGAPIKTLEDGVEPLGVVMASFAPADITTLTPGKYTVEATLGCPASATTKKEAKVSADFYVARLGATELKIGPGDGARVPLMYHAVAGTLGNSFPLTESLAASSLAIPTGEPDLDDNAGVARAFPEVWTDLGSPKTNSTGAVIEEGVSYPVSLKVGTKPDITFTLGKTTKGGAAIPASAPPLRIVLEGAAATDTPITDTAKLRLDASPVDNVGRYDVTLKWKFEAKDDTAWKAIPGATQEAKIRIYGVLGNDIGTTAPNLPWVAIVDAATAKINGATKDPVEVRKLLVAMVYEELTLKYDRRNGASFYTSYTSGSYGGARFDLGSFLRRSRGNTVNCTDCASILSTYTNMVGAPLKYTIITGPPGSTGFSLNPIMGIGSTTFGSPFDSGRMGFSYHAVTSHDGAKTINDATLALDGDTDPKVAPQTKLLVQNIGGADYLTRLSPGTPEYRYVDQSTTVR